MTSIGLPIQSTSQEGENIYKQKIKTRKLLTAQNMTSELVNHNTVIVID